MRTGSLPDRSEDEAGALGRQPVVQLPRPASTTHRLCVPREGQCVGSALAPTVNARATLGASQVGLFVAPLKHAKAGSPHIVLPARRTREA